MWSWTFSGSSSLLPQYSFLKPGHSVTTSNALAHWPPAWVLVWSSCWSGEMLRYMICVTDSVLDEVVAIVMDKNLLPLLAAMWILFSWSEQAHKRDSVCQVLNVTPDRALYFPMGL